MRSVQIHVEATSPVRPHCDHEDGTFSLKADDKAYHPIRVYFTGTPDELRAFGKRIISAATEAEWVKELGEELTP